jgi:hypothetical protein
VTKLHCPICGKQFDSEETLAMPFCSVRCQQIDLGRWFNEQYSLPHRPEQESDETPDENLN